MLYMDLFQSEYVIFTVQHISRLFIINTSVYSRFQFGFVYQKQKINISCQCRVRVDLWQTKVRYIFTVYCTLEYTLEAVDIKFAQTVSRECCPPFFSLS